MANGAIALAGVFGSWQLKKWGYYTLIAFYVIGMVAGLVTVRFSASSLIGSIIGLSITSGLALNKWEDFE